MLLKSNLGKALTLLLIYELSMVIFRLDGLSLGKLVITLLVWVSFALTFRETIVNFNRFHNKIPRLPLIIFGMLILWNAVSILRTILFDGDSISTILGNTYTSLALLVPFALVYGTNVLTIRTLQRYFFVMLITGLILFFIFFSLNLGKGLNVNQTLILLLLLQPVVFLLTTLHFQKRNRNIIILVSFVILFYMAYLYSVRTMGVRQILLGFCFIGVYVYYKYRFKWVLYVSFLIVALPFILVQQSVSTGESAIKKYLSSSADDDLSIDTRTFVYKELYADLHENRRLWIGKGANGRYYSDYFSQVEGDAAIRLNIEVGVLGLLLKGGYIAVSLNLLLIVLAIGFAFFKSNNSYVIGMGFILLVHLVLLFLENVISYSVYNFLIWIVMGLCLSKNIRMLNNRQILRLIR